MDKILQELTKQEQVIQFTSFTADDILSLGNALIKKAKEKKIAIVIDISRNEQQMFHYSFDGTSVDNEEWIKRKIMVVKRFGRSSFFIGQSLKAQGKTIKEAFCIDEDKFAPYGGAFPIIIKNVGPIGVIAVSGLPDHEDHALIIETLKEHLNL